MTYINPMLADVKALGKSSFHRNMFQEAVELDLLVKDSQGNLTMPYGAGLLDLTRPEVREWTKSIIKEQMLEAGVVGFMCDFGEAMPIDSSSSMPGLSTQELHNYYPTLWAQTAREAIKEKGLEGEAIFFSRSSGIQGPAYSPLYWNGDQLPTFDQNDGLRSSITGMLSGGLSGMALSHSDIGGYTAVHFPGLGEHFDRDFELLARWCEAAAFTSVYRSHVGTLPSSLQIYSNNETILHFAKFAHVYASWGVLRKELMLQAETTGMPMARALMINYAQCPEAWTIQDQWLLGDDLLVAPLMDAKAISRSVWLPPSTQHWRHIWSGQLFPGDQHVVVNSSIGEPPIFTRSSLLTDLFLFELRQRGVL